MDSSSNKDIGCKTKSFYIICTVYIPVIVNTSLFICESCKYIINKL